jgi:hypothetical protein
MRRILVKLPEKIKFNGTSTHEIVTLLNVPGHFLDTPFPAQIIEDVLLPCVLDGIDIVRHGRDTMVLW